MPVSDTDICEYEVDLGLIETAVRKAGLIAKAAFISDKPEIWNKSGNHPVTDADIAVNDYLAGILGEA
ncbi:MAG: 3'(2'),5'-bisphosphate nucleotidase CysQ, partial [Hyphomonadaceae bacterium]|nr:3'(2'),5'-bisphosphate nucleotidase CysQ [Hyphomonadaceae bacterium]